MAADSSRKDALSQKVFEAKNLLPEVQKGLETLSSALLEGNYEIWNKIATQELDSMKENIEAREQFFSQLIAQRERNFDKEIDSLKKMYEKRLEVVQGNEELEAEIKTEMNRRIELLQHERSAILSPEEITSAESSKMRESLAKTMGTGAFKETSDVSGVVGQLTGALGGDLGVLGEGVGTIAKVVSSILIGLGPIAIGVGLLVGLISIIKKLEEHSRETELNTRKLALGAGAEGMTTGSYLDLVKTVQIEFNLSRKEAMKELETVYSSIGASQEEYASLLIESVRAQQELGMGFSDLTANLRRYLGEGEDVSIVGMIYDSLVDLNTEFREEGLHFTTAELKKGFDTINQSLYAYGYNLDDSVKLLTMFRNEVDDATFSIGDLVNIASKFAKMQTEELGGFIELGEQLGAITGLTGDIYDKVWQMKTGGLETESMNAIMAITESMVESQGFTLDKFAAVNDILTKQIGLSLDPRQVEAMVELWRSTGGDFTKSAETFGTIIDKDEVRHKENLESSISFQNSVMGSLKKIQKSLERFGEGTMDVATAVKRQRTQQEIGGN